jgi:hypothetical protein
MHFLKSQKNEIYDLIVKHDLSPSDFVIEQSKELAIVLSGGEETTITHSSSYYIKFTLVENKNTIQVSPGKEKLVELWKTDYSWESKKKILVQWLNNLKYELTQEDKWLKFWETKNYLDIQYTGDDNIKFSYQEVLQIKEATNKAKELILQLDLPANDGEIINSKLDYIAERCENMNKVDWKNILVGTLVSLIVQLALSKEVAVQIWEIFKQAYNTVLFIALK